MKTLLNERGKTHGDYSAAARTKEGILDLITMAPSYPKMDATARASIRMIVEKLGRIVHGDHTHIDHWVDIAGYATLAANHYKQKEPEQLELPFDYEEGVV